MVGKRGSLRSRFLGGAGEIEGVLGEALESRLDDEEPVLYRLTSGAELRHEHSDGTDEKGGDGETVLAVTDRKLVFVVGTGSGIETADVPYTDLKSVEVEGGLLGTTVSISVWGRGTFHLRPSETDVIDDLVTFVTEASETWQRVVAMLQDARQYVATLPEQIREGDMAGANETTASVRETLTDARQRAGTALEPIQPVLEDRIAEVEVELTRTRMDARCERGSALLSRAGVMSDAGRYDEAYTRLDRAADHLGAALATAVEERYPEVGEIEAERERLFDRIERLEARPLERAERAREWAQNAADSRLALTAWERALEEYRRALTAGWGTDAEFDGGTDALRMQVEWVVATIVRLRARLADRHESIADTARTRSDDRLAQRHYQIARSHLETSIDLARQYRAGDLEMLKSRAAWVISKHRCEV